MTNAAKVLYGKKLDQSLKKEEALTTLQLSLYSTLKASCTTATWSRVKQHQDYHAVSTAIEKNGTDLLTIIESICGPTQPLCHNIETVMDALRGVTTASRHKYESGDAYTGDGGYAILAFF